MLIRIITLAILSSLLLHCKAARQSQLATIDVVSNSSEGEVNYRFGKTGRTYWRAWCSKQHCSRNAIGINETDLYEMIDKNSKSVSSPKKLRTKKDRLLSSAPLPADIVPETDERADFARDTDEELSQNAQQLEAWEAVDERLASETILDLQVGEHGVTKSRAGLEIGTNFDLIVRHLTWAFATIESKALRHYSGYHHRHSPAVRYPAYESAYLIAYERHSVTCERRHYRAATLAAGCDALEQDKEVLRLKYKKECFENSFLGIGKKRCLDLVSHKVDLQLSVVNQCLAKRDAMLAQMTKKCVIDEWARQ